MKRIEFHCHTKYSICSNLEPKLILKLCKKRGLNGVLICDHDTLEGYSAFKKILQSNDDFLLIPGVEILTERGEILAAWIEEYPKTTEFPEVCDRIREQDGIIIVPHPFDAIRSAFKPTKDDINYIDGIEVLNSRCLYGNKKALKFANSNSLLKSAGSDAHFASEVGTAWIAFNGETSLDLKKNFISNNTEYGGRKAPLSFFLKMGFEMLQKKF